MRMHLFTSAAANYQPRVRALFASLRRVRPEWRLHLVLADRPSGSELEATGADEVHHLADLGVPAWRSWAFCHSLVELATAVKGLALARLLARPDCDAAIYLDPDIVVFSDLADVVEALQGADVLLTPHQTQPEATTGGVIAREVCTAQHGIYNLGFLAVAARGQGPAFAHWWRERLYRFCREDIASGLYTDQRWMDFAPAYFDRVRVLRGAHLNVAPWNLGARRLAGPPVNPTIDGKPLGFFHFSAVDQGAFDAYRDDPVVAEMVDAYRRETAGAGPAWGFAAFSDGETILPEQRLVFRLRQDLQAAFPDPFASGPASFQAWWRAQAPVEFPALFDPAGRAAEIARLRSALTTGYPDL
ncbi:MULTISPECIES: glycosyl transferase [unclassified Phenylobacterium]|uniref:glycosyl transferase n=1 Tax=unclassified Phenylobacterium TaxID=2640670 RepID=UPI000A5D0F92|nr:MULTISPECIES: glycosyl transferase [unclassified Phenylobacterium]